ncbi:MAG: hypothetical protein M3Q18_00580 [Actinomycetota bacterium]|nr:hypothetical protein [Actinomycetota bacterium]
MRLELILQLEHVAEQVVLDGELGEPSGLGEEGAVLLRVPRQVRDRLRLAGLSFLARATVSRRRTDV